MKLKDKLMALGKQSVEEKTVGEIERVYGAKLDDTVKRLASISRKSVSYDDFSLLRSLSLQEILDASEDMQVDFVSLRLLPLFDAGDNDYIAYDLNKKCWCMYNIADEIKFRESKNLSDYLQDQG
jgi:hypothetical protein